MFDAGFFASPTALLTGALTGLIFGFLLQKGGLTRADVIISQFLFRDYTVLKVMLTAIVVGGVGVYAMLQLGMIEKLHVKSATLVANIVGGLIFGKGMAILGYCPGSGVAAIGDGSRDAIPGVFGMLAGAAVYAEMHPWLKANVLPLADLGKVTIAQELGLSPWWLLAGLAVATAAGFFALERFEHARALRPAL